MYMYKTTYLRSFMSLLFVHRVTNDFISSFSQPFLVKRWCQYELELHECSPVRVSTQGICTENEIWYEILPLVLSHC